jgi:hypothetical protein
MLLPYGLIGTSTPMPHKRSQGTPDEETPLLRDGNLQRKETPLPLAQILVLLLLQLSEPITSSSIRPYINQVRSSIPITSLSIMTVSACTRAPNR